MKFNIFSYFGSGKENKDSHKDAKARLLEGRLKHLVKDWKGNAIDSNTAMRLVSLIVGPKPFDHAIAFNNQLGKLKGVNL